MDEFRTKSTFIPDTLKGQKPLLNPELISWGRACNLRNCRRCFGKEVKGKSQRTFRRFSLSVSLEISTFKTVRHQYTSNRAFAIATLVSYRLDHSYIRLVKFSSPELRVALKKMDSNCTKGSFWLVGGCEELSFRPLYFAFLVVVVFHMTTGLFKRVNPEHRANYALGSHAIFHLEKQGMLATRLSQILWVLAACFVGLLQGYIGRGLRTQFLLWISETPPKRILFLNR